jgi:hypothetical protein
MASRVETNEEMRNRFHKKVFVENVTRLNDELAVQTENVKIFQFKIQTYEKEIKEVLLKQTTAQSDLQTFLVHKCNELVTQQLSHTKQESVVMDSRSALLNAALHPRNLDAVLTKALLLNFDVIKLHEFETRGTAVAQALVDEIKATIDSVNEMKQEVVRTQNSVELQRVQLRPLLKCQSVLAATIALAPLYWELYAHRWCEKWIEDAYNGQYDVPDKVTLNNKIEPLVALEVASHPELQVLLENARWYLPAAWKEDDRKAAIDVSEVD